jgi:hypothetical protein
MQEKSEMKRYRQAVSTQTDAELLRLCNIPRESIDTSAWAQAAYDELTKRGKQPVIAGYDQDNAPVYEFKEA